VRQLVVVALSADGSRVLLGTSPGARPSHELLVDDRLARAVRGQPLDDGPAAPSALSPKEIQARLRAGASVDDVAKEAGVPRSRVERYAGPVLSERENVLDVIRAATLTRARVGRSARPLGDAVAMNLASLAFARPETAEWSAYRRGDGAWVARLEVIVRGRRRRAEWAHDSTSGEVSALDPYAATLGFSGAAAPKPPAAKATAKPIGKAAAKKAGTKAAVAAPPKASRTKPAARQRRAPT
jgi:hypothetical protein